MRYVVQVNTPEELRAELIVEIGRRADSGGEGAAALRLFGDDLFKMLIEPKPAKVEAAVDAEVGEEVLLHNLRDEDAAENQPCQNPSIG
jgi:hypothetical protein